MTSLCPITKVPLAPGRFVSDQGISRFQESLTDLGSTMQALDAALAKELRFGDQENTRVHHSVDSGLIVNLAAADARFVARQTILVWIDWLAQVRGFLVPSGWADVGKQFVSQASWLAMSERGGVCVDEVFAAVRQALSVCDAPRPKVYLGACVCGARVHASRNQGSVACRCGMIHSVADRQLMLLAQLADQRFSPSALSTLFASLGLHLPAGTIRQWIYRRQVERSADGILVRDAILLSGLGGEGAVDKVSL